MTFSARVREVREHPTVQGQEARYIRLVSEEMTMELLLAPGDARIFQVGDTFRVKLTEVKD